MKDKNNTPNYNNIVDDFLSTDLDLRKKDKDNRRWIDQKVTPDVLQFISEIIHKEFLDKSFTVATVMENEIFKDQSESIFSKPRLEKNSSVNEYNKFVGQPIKTLAYAGILSETKNKRGYTYRVINPEVLYYISVSENSARTFLVKFIKKVLTDSDFYPKLESYISNQKQNKSPKESFNRLKQDFLKWYLQDTNITTATEINRIFTKVINPICFEEKIKGTVRGHLSKGRISLDDLRYNRINFRDKDKPKEQTRDSFEGELTLNKNQERQLKRFKDFLVKTFPYGEVNDKLAKKDLSETIHVHHIIPRHHDKNLIAIPENLITLTTGQHYSFAHPHGNTKDLCKKYQLICLLSKIESAKYLILHGFFSQDQFESVVLSHLEGIPDASKESIMTRLTNEDPNFISTIEWNQTLPGPEPKV